jgi:hypothetical protein
MRITFSSNAESLWKKRIHVQNASYVPAGTLGRPAQAGYIWRGITSSSTLFEEVFRPEHSEWISIEVSFSQ